MRIKMNRRIKAILTVCLLIAGLFLIAGCGDTENPYLVNNSENYTVSVKYDANGGTFTTNTSVIVDSYNISQMETDGSGDVSIALLSPDDSRRGTDAFTAVKSGYFLAGWYTGRTENTDGTYSYSGLWDFASGLLTLDADGSYSAEEPVVTLYAAWIPMFDIQFYSLDGGEYLGSYTFNPTTAGEIRLPAWDEESGSVEMYDFPSLSGYTFHAAYYDAEGTQSVSTETVVHSGEVDYETGTAVDPSMKIYIDWREGEWYRIYNAEQFLDNASVSGCYEICADLDFTGEIWPSSLMYGNFSGTIQGNGHTIRNVSIEQTNNSKVNAGLFGYLSEDAVLSDVTFENVTFTIKSGTRVAGTSYGLLAGSISGDAGIEGVSVKSSQMLIDSGCYFGVDDYVIGLLCGMGDASVVQDWEISCEAAGSDPDTLSIDVDGNTVTVEFIRE